MFLVMLIPYKGIGTIITIPTQYPTIQEGIYASWHGDTVLVAPGTYYENIDLSGKNIVLASEFILTGNSSLISSTIIDGNNADRVIIIENGEDITCKIIGFTIQHGNTPSYGGGILIWESSPEIRNCIIQNNSAYLKGGGLCITGLSSAAKALNCTIQNNTAESYGGGLYMGDCGPDAEVIACTISQNTNTWDGGSSGIINGSGGGVNLQHNGKLTNCLIINNNAPNFVAGAGGIQCDFGTWWGSQNIFITGCTIANNTALGTGGVSQVFTGGELRNCIIWGNTDSYGNSSNYDGNFFVNCCSNPLPDGMGNIDSDPSFIHAATGNFRLQEGSACINAGNDSFNNQVLDLDGNPRVAETIDMGAYEKVLSVTTTVQIGNGIETSENFPIYTCYGFNYSQQLYLGSEILAGGGGAGYITKVRFFYAGSVAYSTWNDWTVYLGNTTKTEFTSDIDWVPVSSLSQVFSGIIPDPVEGTWLELVLQTPFYYSGDNIVVAIDENTYDYNCTAQWGSFDSGSPRGLLSYDDVTNPDPNSPPSANLSFEYHIARIQFEIGTGYGVLEGFVTETPDCTLPIAGATVTNGVSAATTNALGYYSLVLPSGTYYNISASNGGTSQIISPITIVGSDTTTQNFCLSSYLAPPVDLKASVTGPALNTVHLTWQKPGATPEQWIHWDNGNNNGGLGYANPTIFEVASRWPIADIASYDGMYLKKIRFYVPESVSIYTLKVWSGPNAETLLHSQLLTNLNINAWNEITLSSPVLIDAAQDFWFGYEVNQTSGYPIGLSPGPAIAGKGDMLNNGYGWVSVKNSWNFDYNWSLQGFVSGDPTMTPSTLLPLVQDVLQPTVLKPTLPESTVPEILLSPSTPASVVDYAMLGSKQSTLPIGTSAIPTGYNVYRDNVKIADNIPDLYYDDTELAKGVYSYEVSAQYAAEESTTIGPLQVNIYTCFPPTNLNVSNPSLNTTTAELSWTPSTLSSNLEWELAWGAVGFNPNYVVPIHITTSPSLVLTGLVAGEEYDFYVRTYCSADDVSAWVKKTFRTHYFNCLASAKAEAEPCGNSTNNGCSMMVPTFETIQNGDTICGSAWLLYQNRDVDWFELTLTETCDVSLMAMVEFSCFIGIKTASCTVNEFIATDYFYPWWQHPIRTRLTAGTYYINLTPNFNGNVICDSLSRYQLSLICNPCLSPNALSAVNITETSADLAWISNASAWNIEWGQGNFTQGNGTLIPGITQNPYTLTGLTSGYTYNYYVQGVCGTGSVSAWTGPFSFFVPCATTALPYSEDFSTHLVGKTPQCWQLQGISNSQNWVSNNTNMAGGKSPELSFVTYDPYYDGRVYMVSPLFNTVGLTELSLTFKQRIHSSNSLAQCEVWTTSDGGVSWNSVWSVTPNGMLDPETINLTISNADVGSDKFQFAFAVNGISWSITTWDIDDIMLTALTGGKTLNLKVFLEGLYNSGGSMKQAYDITGPKYATGIADKVSIELHNATIYSTIEYSTGLINLNTNGTVINTIPNTLAGSYYITVNHRNSIGITSATPVDFSSSTITYDFTVAASQAYGSNQKDLGEGVFGLFGGDANFDGTVDMLDILLIETSSLGFSSGYISIDINGDGMVDALDLILTDNNASLPVSAITP